MLQIILIVIAAICVYLAIGILVVYFATGKENEDDLFFESLIYTALENWKSVIAWLLIVIIMTGCWAKEKLLGKKR